jgi:hypothetical protein
MSTINGPFDFNGSMGNMRSYYDPSLGKQVLSGKGGPTREQFLTDPNYARQRQVSSEFIGRSIWASQVRQSLSDIGHLMYSRCFNQIMTSGKYIQQRDTTSPNGQLGVIVNNNPEILTGIDFNKLSPFSKVIGDIYEISLSPDKKTVSLSIPGFISSRDVIWMTKFYAVRFYLVIAQISDVVWNVDINGYEKVVSGLQVLTRSTTGNWIVKNNEPVDVNLTASFEEPALILQGTTVIAAMGVEFSIPANNGQSFVMPRNGSMGIVGYWTK